MLALLCGILRIRFLSSMVRQTHQPVEPLSTVIWGENCGRGRGAVTVEFVGCDCGVGEKEKAGGRCCPGRLVIVAYHWIRSVYFYSPKSLSNGLYSAETL